MSTPSGNETSTNTDPLSLLDDSVGAPDVDKTTGDTSQSESNVREYARLLDADAEVHSAQSLERSRQNCIRILSTISETYPKTHIAVEMVEQEMKLQESIRKRSYSDMEMIANVRRWLALLVCICSFLFGGFSMLYAWTHPNNSDVLTSMMDFSKWMFTVSGSVVLTFYFPSISKEVRAHWHKK